MPKTPGRRSREIHPDDLLVHFSPEMVRLFARLETLLEGSEQITPEVGATLSELACGKAFPPKSAFFWLAKIVQETSNHILVTGDKRAGDSLNELWDLLGGADRGPDYAPFTFSPMKLGIAR